MSRIIVKTAKGPQELKPSKKSVSICMCGLSKNQPFCNGSHKATLDEKDEEMYEYDKNGKRVEVQGEEGCCGGGCCNPSSS